MEESSFNVKINKNIQNKVALFVRPVDMEEIGFFFPKLLSVSNWGESGLAERVSGGCGSGKFSYWNEFC